MEIYYSVWQFDTSYLEEIERLILHYFQKTDFLLRASKYELLK